MPGSGTTAEPDSPPKIPFPFTVPPVEKNGSKFSPPPISSLPGSSANALVMVRICCVVVELASDRL